MHFFGGGWVTGVAGGAQRDFKESQVAMCTVIKSECLLVLPCKVEANAAFVGEEAGSRGWATF